VHAGVEERHKAKLVEQKKCGYGIVVDRWVLLKVKIAERPAERDEMEDAVGI
jgi:hypothetical protein